MTTNHSRTRPQTIYLRKHKSIKIKTPDKEESISSRRRRCAFSARNTEPDPEHVQLGMKVKLATYSIGSDDNGTEAIGFGFEKI